VEPGDGLHENQRGLQELLCRAAGAALARDGGSELTGAVVTIALPSPIIQA
jgi:hypothetical protein